MKVAISGGTPITIATGQNHPQAIAVGSTRVFWTNVDDGTVMAAEK
jgi:hypothetical protein